MAISGDNNETPDLSNLNNSKTIANLRAAFSNESKASERYLLFAQIADSEGLPEIAAIFRSMAEAEAIHAIGHLDRLATLDEVALSEPVTSTRVNLLAALDVETYEYTSRYPGFARIARDEGLTEVADWFETLAKSGRSHAGRLSHGLDTLHPTRQQGTMGERGLLNPTQTSRMSEQTRDIYERVPTPPDYRGRRK
jgi:rubrerythrin